MPNQTYKFQYSHNTNIRYLYYKIITMDIKKIIENAILESKKDDRCTRLAKQKYDVWPSAYASGAVVKCRKGKIWKKKKKLDETKKTDLSKENEEGLHGWFSRQGAKGKTKGWVDCNTCRTDKDGKKNCKPCGRSEGEDRKKYPACRPTPSACKTEGKGDKWGKKMKMESIDGLQVSEELQYHIDNNISLNENIFRPGSKKFFDLINEVRTLYNNDLISLNEDDTWIVESDLGRIVILENGEKVMLDLPYELKENINESEYKGKNVKLNTPMRGGAKKYYVYVKNPSTGNVKKISFGDKHGGLTAKVSNPEARKSFAARHNCKDKKDKTKAGYWACRLPRFSNLWGRVISNSYW